MNVDDRLSPRAARRVEEEALQDQIHELNFMAAMRYRPRPYPGVVTNFKPRRNYSAFPDPDMGWNGLALEGVKTIELDLFPHAMMTEPFLELLADRPVARAVRSVLWSTSSRHSRLKT